MTEYSLSLQLLLALLSGLSAQLLREHGSEVAHDLVLLLLLLLERDERKGALLLGGVHLVLLAQTHGVHARVARARHPGDAGMHVSYSRSLLADSARD